MSALIDGGNSHVYMLDSGNSHVYMSDGVNSHVCIVRWWQQPCLHC